MVQATLRPMFLFDVADAIRVEARPRQAEPSAGHNPRYLGFDPPPLIRQAGEARIALFAFGVVGVQYAIPFRGSWDELAQATANLLDDAAIQAKALAQAREALRVAASSIEVEYAEWLQEDYLIVEIPATDAQILRDSHGDDIARLVRGEVQTLSRSEVADVMGNSISCYPNDLLVAGWAAAFVADTPDGALATCQLLEFANAQLLELRHYGRRVREVLNGLHRVQENRRMWLRRWHTVREAERLNQIRLDVVELMERSDNSLRVLGDMFYARAYRIVSHRLGVDDYRKLLEDRVHTAGELYQFLVGEFNHSRAFTLEAMVVIILVVELAMALTGHRG